MGVGRLAVYSGGGGGRKGQFRGKDCLYGTTGGGAWPVDGGWVAMFIIGGLIVPRSLGGGGMHYREIYVVSISGGNGNL